VRNSIEQEVITESRRESPPKRKEEKAVRAENLQLVGREEELLPWLHLIHSDRGEKGKKKNGTRPGP